MELYGVELKNAGWKPKKEDMVTAPQPGKTENPKIQYPSMRVRDKESSYDLPLDLSQFKAGDKAILVAVVNIKEKTKRESQTPDKNESETMGEIEFLKCGLKKYKDLKDMTEQDLTDSLNEDLQ